MKVQYDELHIASARSPKRPCIVEGYYEVGNNAFRLNAMDINRNRSYPALRTLPRAGTYRRRWPPRLIWVHLSFVLT